MRIINPSVHILDELNGQEILKRIELCGRVCYKSEHRITPQSAEAFVANLIKRGHESVLEHVSFSVKFICDRGISHEIVRHRLASYSQESTRYCNYAKGDFNGEITVVAPSYLDKLSRAYSLWVDAMEKAEMAYFKLLNEGLTPQQARAVLPNSLKTELIMTANLRTWRHFLKLRTSSAAHPQMREVAGMLHDELRQMVPVLFDDIKGVH